MKKIMYAALLATVSVAAADLKVGSPFGDNMVLQRNTEVLVWGSAGKGDTIHVKTSWNGLTYTTASAKDGSWCVKVSTGEAGLPYEMDITSPDSIVRFRNIALGEVWIAGGQSNMSMPLKGYEHQPVEGSTEAVLGSKGKTIRFANVKPLAAYKPLKYVDGVEWKEASPATVADCSAVAWFFADRLHEILDVPVGIINASFSGSNLEAWITPETCARFPNLDVPPLSDETSPWIGNVATLLYNGMFKPVEGYGIRGMIFYQGESNIFDVKAYAPLFEATVADWRNRWGGYEWPFYFVQITPYDYKEWNFFKPEWPEISAYLREAQLKSSYTIPNSAMVVTMDLGADYIIHPPKKKPIGDRLALLALSKTYGIGGFECESPRYSHMEILDGKAILHFDHMFNGITSYGKPLKSFEICGDNGVFVPAEAYIDQGGGTVVVWSRLVSEPKAVRYAFRDFAEAELFGTGGLPVSSFRTDNFE